MPSTATKKPSFKEAVFVFLQIALYSFGGPAHQIAVMHRLLVEEKQWIGEKQFLHALNFCMLLPGPEAHQLVIYMGWLLYRIRGGIVAGCLFIVPGFFSILLLSILYVNTRSTHFMVLSALMRIGEKSLKLNIHYFIAAASFCALFFLNLPFPMVILCAALAGYVYDRATAKIPRETLNSIRFYPLQFMKTAFIGLVVWGSPALMIYLALGERDVFTRQAVLFSKTAVLSFGGAYAVLAYIAQEAVQTYQWIEPAEMLDGLGMAESTPGPLIQVVQFVGFLAAYRYADGIDPLWAGILASILVTWVTFVPSFLWIFAGAPYVEALRKRERLNAVLNAVTAAVAGVILNLSLWFTLNVLFKKVPVWSSFDKGSAFILLVALTLVFRFKAGLFLTLMAGAALGVILKQLAF